ncbi:MAG: GrpB family protein, partial [Anaerolineales bacterium]|nr:GrpB family protein [Anaerolineales bacterium]
DTEGIRTQHIHVYQVGHKEIQRHLQFRNYLRTHPEDALVYSQLKEELSKTYRNDPEGYTNGKDEFVEKIVSVLRNGKIIECKNKSGPSNGLGSKARCILIWEPQPVNLQWTRSGRC